MHAGRPGEVELSGKTKRGRIIYLQKKIDSWVGTWSKGASARVGLGFGGEHGGRPSRA